MDTILHSFPLTNHSTILDSNDSDSSKEEIPDSSVGVNMPKVTTSSKDVVNETSDEMQCQGPPFTSEVPITGQSESESVSISCNVAEVSNVIPR